MKRKVLVLGACGMVAPNLVPGLRDYYDLKLTDFAPDLDSELIIECEIRSFQEVCEAAEGMDAILNFTVVRDHSEESFHVNTRGALNVMKAAVEHGIKKVIHSGPQYVRSTYDHDFDITDVPPVLGTAYYCLPKGLASEVCRSYARAHQIQTISFVFNGLGPSPSEDGAGQDFPPFTVVWEDLQLACRLALDIEAVPDDFQEFNLLSWEGHGKYNVDKARRILGFAPTEKWERYFERRL